MSNNTSYSRHLCDGTEAAREKQLPKNAKWIAGRYIGRFNNSGHFTVVNEKDGDIEQPYIKKVIYRNPATIVFWSDGTKTVAKCSQYDKYDAEKGLSICVLKKLCGSTKVTSLFNHWVPSNEFKANEAVEVTVKEVRDVERGKKCALKASIKVEVVEE